MGNWLDCEIPSIVEAAVIRCRIRLGFSHGIVGLKLTGHFSSTCAAVNEALDMFPTAQRVSVVAL